MPNLRGLLPAVLLAGSGLVGVGSGLAATVATAAPAQAACAAPSGSLSVHAREASAVFTGTVTGSRREGDGRVYNVDVDRVYKGQGIDERAQVATPLEPARCGLRLDRGRYVFFVTTDGDRFATDSRSGTGRASADLVGRVERMLGQGRPAVAPEPTQATFTTVAGSTTSTGRVVAPGVALVIVGLLGWLLAAALGRRRG